MWITAVPWSCPSIGCHNHSLLLLLSGWEIATAIVWVIVTIYYRKQKVLVSWKALVNWFLKWVMCPQYPIVNWTCVVVITQEAKVLRDGTQQTIMAEDLVVGDIVDVQFGDKIPADIRIIRSSGFKVLV